MFDQGDRFRQVVKSNTGVPEGVLGYVEVFRGNHW